LDAGFFMTHMKVICMKKIALSVAITLMATVVLVACNGSTTNASDVSSDGSAPNGKAVCTSSNNWQSVGVGMNADQVQARLGKPIRFTATSDSTVYFYESCRGFAKKTADAVPATDTTAYIPAKYTVTLKGGSVTINGNRGVTSIAGPEPETEFSCELDFYNYANVSALGYTSAGDIILNCRASNYPF
jgi:outer membrane protein assembly factor BamE (lipoprotein component of BamABCDE complex)